jgi:hypothetical protein
MVRNKMLRFLLAYIVLIGVKLGLPLTLYPLTITRVAPPRNASKWQMGFN